MKAAAKEAGELQRKLSADKDAEVLAAFRRISAIEVTEVDREGFANATASVAESWKKKPFGDFVAQIESAAKG
ncbi:hypothetical protein [Sinorhizobium fredii]|uniref:hypothetical protein n=1 Tax=Rhizobium fredii TaxID=380 RepID=UPI0004B79B1E|nr:hypothetical protein [Sinorhizobium fredii]ASY73683.1 TrapT dctQ-M fusion permease, dicarboxylate transport [Sinorhizobium fredii CCBAU 83666]